MFSGRVRGGGDTKPFKAPKYRSKPFNGYASRDVRLCKQRRSKPFNEPKLVYAMLLGIGSDYKGVRVQGLTDISVLTVPWAG
jgi:hypothetical protein